MNGREDQVKGQDATILDHLNSMESPSSQVPEPQGYRYTGAESHYDATSKYIDSLNFEEDIVNINKFANKLDSEAVSMIESVKSGKKQATADGGSNFSDYNVFSGEISKALKIGDEKERKTKLDEIRRSYVSQNLINASKHNDYVRRSAETAKVLGEDYGTGVGATAERFGKAYMKGANTINVALETMFGDDKLAKAAIDNYNRPEWQYTTESNIDFLATLAGQTLPFMQVVLAGSLVGGLAGAGVGAVAGISSAATYGGLAGSMFTAGAVEGSSMYQEALASGVSKEKATMIGIGGGLISGAIEVLPIPFASKLTRGVAKKAATLSFIKRMGIGTSKNLYMGGSFVKNAIRESIEEGLQELTSILAPAIVAGIVPRDKMGNIDYEGIIDRVTSASIGGLVLAGTMNSGQIVANAGGSLGRYAFAKSKSDIYFPGSTEPLLKHSKTVAESGTGIDRNVVMEYPGGRMVHVVFDPSMITQESDTEVNIGQYEHGQKTVVIGEESYNVDGTIYLDEALIGNKKTIEHESAHAYFNALIDNNPSEAVRFARDIADTELKGRSVPEGEELSLAIESRAENRGFKQNVGDFFARLDVSTRKDNASLNNTVRSKLVDVEKELGIRRGNGDFFMKPETGSNSTVTADEGIEASAQEVVGKGIDEWKKDVQRSNSKVSISKQEAEILRTEYQTKAKDGKQAARKMFNEKPILGTPKISEVEGIDSNSLEVLKKYAGEGNKITSGLLTNAEKLTQIGVTTEQADIISNTYNNAERIAFSVLRANERTYSQFVTDSYKAAKENMKVPDFNFRGMAKIVRQVANGWNPFGLDERFELVEDKSSSDYNSASIESTINNGQVKINIGAGLVGKVISDIAAGNSVFDFGVLDTPVDISEIMSAYDKVYVPAKLDANNVDLFLKKYGTKPPASIKRVIDLKNKEQVSAMIARIVAQSTNMTVEPTFSMVVSYTIETMKRNRQLANQPKWDTEIKIIQQLADEWRKPNHGGKSILYFRNNLNHRTRNAMSNIIPRMFDDSELEEIGFSKEANEIVNEGLSKKLEVGRTLSEAEDKNSSFLRQEYDANAENEDAGDVIAGFAADEAVTGREHELFGEGFSERDSLQRYISSILSNDNNLSSKKLTNILRHIYPSLEELVNKTGSNSDPISKQLSIAKEICDSKKPTHVNVLIKLFNDINSGLSWDLNQLWLQDYNKEMSIIVDSITKDPMSAIKYLNDGKVELVQTAMSILNDKGIRTWLTPFNKNTPDSFATGSEFPLFTSSKDSSKEDFSIRAGHINFVIALGSILNSMYGIPTSRKNQYVNQFKDTDEIKSILDDSTSSLWVEVPTLADKTSSEIARMIFEKVYSEFYNMTRDEFSNLSGELGVLVNQSIEKTIKQFTDKYWSEVTGKKSPEAVFQNEILLKDTIDNNLSDVENKVISDFTIYREKTETILRRQRAEAERKGDTTRVEELNMLLNRLSAVELQSIANIADFLEKATGIKQPFNTIKNKAESRDRALEAIDYYNRAIAEMLDTSEVDRMLGSSHTKESLTSALNRTLEDKSMRQDVVIAEISRQKRNNSSIPKHDADMARKMWNSYQGLNNVSKVAAMVESTKVRDAILDALDIEETLPNRIISSFLRVMYGKEGSNTSKVDSNEYKKASFAAILWIDRKEYGKAFDEYANDIINTIKNTKELKPEHDDFIRFKEAYEEMLTWDVGNKLYDNISKVYRDTIKPSNAEYASFFREHNIGAVENEEGDMDLPVYYNDYIPHLYQSDGFKSVDDIDFNATGEHNRFKQRKFYGGIAQAYFEGFSLVSEDLPTLWNIGNNQSRNTLIDKVMFDTMKHQGLIIPKSQHVDGKRVHIPEPKGYKTIKLPKIGEVFMVGKLADSFEIVNKKNPFRELGWFNNVMNMNAIAKMARLAANMFHQNALVMSLCLAGPTRHLTPKQLKNSFKQGRDAINGLDEETRAFIGKTVRSFANNEDVTLPSGSDSADLTAAVYRGMTLFQSKDIGEGIVKKPDFLEGMNAPEPLKTLGSAVLSQTQRYQRFLFQDLGNDCKAACVLAELKVALKHNEEALLNGDLEIEDLYSNVAKAVDNDFGGRNTEFQGAWASAFSQWLNSKTGQDITRIAFLGPDWTRTNMAMVKDAFYVGDDVSRKNLAQVNRAMLGRAFVRGFFVMMVLNIVMSAIDDETMVERLQKASRRGGFHWMDADISPILHQFGIADGKDVYLNTLAQYKDPIKIFFNPVQSLYWKGSPTSQFATDLARTGSISNIPDTFTKTLFRNTPMNMQHLVRTVQGEADALETIASGAGLGVDTYIAK